MLVLDVLRSQKTAAVKETFKRLNTLPVMVPPGCTSLVQPLDVCINHSFKERIEALSHEHYHQNINGWTDQKFTAGERRILMTKWVAQAWKDISKDLVETVIRSFRKCGISPNSWSGRLRKAVLPDAR